MERHTTRRSVLAGAGGIASGVGLSGCLGVLDDGGGPDIEGDVAVDVIHYEFDPTEVTIQQGETVTWLFRDPTHNVSAVPDHNDRISIPDGAEPFASYDGDNKASTIPQGGSYSHTFDVTGTYVYVCIPHASDMIGWVHVE